VLLLSLILWRQGRWSTSTRWAQFTIGLLAIVVIGVTLSTAGPPTIDAEWFRARGWDGEISEGLAEAGKISRIVRGLLWTVLIWQIFNSGRRLWRLLDHHRLTGSPAHPVAL
jgi:hypothetical protein